MNNFLALKNPLTSNNFPITRYNIHHKNNAIAIPRFSRNSHNVQAITAAIPRVSNNINRCHRFLSLFLFLGAGCHVRGWTIFGIVTVSFIGFSEVSSDFSSNFSASTFSSSFSASPDSTTTSVFFSTSTIDTPLSFSILETFSSDLSTSLAALSFACVFFGLKIDEIISAIKNIHAFNHANWYNCVLSIIHPTIAGCPTSIYNAKKIRSQFVILCL